MKGFLAHAWKRGASSAGPTREKVSRHRLRIAVGSRRSPSCSSAESDGPTPPSKGLSCKLMTFIRPISLKLIVSCRPLPKKLSIRCSRERRNRKDQGGMEGNALSPRIGDQVSVYGPDPCGPDLRTEILNRKIADSRHVK